MLTILFILFILRSSKQIHQHTFLLKILRYAGFRMTTLVLFSLVACSALSQEKKLEYRIKRNGDEVGAIHFSQTIAGNRTTLRLESEVKTRFIFSFTVNAKEETIYDYGIMVWSSIYRKLNGNTKTDKKTKAVGNSYTVYNEGETETVHNYPVRYNMLSIYIMEPVSVSKVYSDIFQQLIDIIKTGDHIYKIKFPDGNFNEYHYVNGICSRVDVHHTLYSAVIELKS